MRVGIYEIVQFMAAMFYSACAPTSGGTNTVLYRIAVDPTREMWKGLALIIPCILVEIYVIVHSLPVLEGHIYLAFTPT
jgi:hypothetical protein